MSPLEERLLQLNAEIEDLKITSEEKEIAYKKVKEFREVLGQIDTKDLKGQQAYLKGMRTYLDTELEFLRTKTDIIRKVSPKTANLLENKINDYDKNTRHILETGFSKNLDNLSEVEIMLELGKFIKTVFDVMTLQETVSIATDTLTGTLDFLNGNK